MTTKSKPSTADALVEMYAKKLEPLMPLAKKAYGLRGQDTPEHRASSQYTVLVKEFFNKGGSLMELSKKIGVHYSGLRRRVYMSETPPVGRKKRSKASPEQTAAAVVAVLKAKNTGSFEKYHAALYKAYHDGISLAAVAKGLNIKSSAPLYYAVQKHASSMPTPAKALAKKK